MGAGVIAIRNIVMVVGMCQWWHPSKGGFNSLHTFRGFLFGCILALILGFFL